MDDALGLHGGGQLLWIQAVVAGGHWAGSEGVNEVLHPVLDRRKQLASSHHSLVPLKKSLDRPYVLAGRQLR